MSGQRAQRARPGRAASQHFLRTPALAAELVRDACVSADDLVLDIGAGSGRLTGELALRARSVVAVEIDPRWAARLRGRWANVQVVEGDATRMALPREPFRVVANLPLWLSYRAFVASGFRRGLRAAAPPRALRRLGVAGAAPRDLDAHQWAELFAGRQAV